MTKDISVAIICLSDPNKDPRPRRLVECLKEKMAVTVIATAKYAHQSVHSYTIKKGGKGKLLNFKDLIDLKLKNYDSVMWTNELLEMKEKLKRCSFDIIIAHNIHVLPLVEEIKGNNSKVIFDAREYYPRHFDDKIFWRFFYKNYNDYLCENYLSASDKMLTVSYGISEEYKKNYSIDSEVFMSFPEYRDLESTKPDGDFVKMIHHGNASPSRKLENMIHMMNHLDDRFSLDLMLMPTNKKYYQFLKKESVNMKNVRIIDPVPYSKIVPFLNQYDIGLYNVPISNFNMEYMLPNKFFEFVQARLMLAVGPSKEMKDIVLKNSIGVCADDYSPKDLASKLNELSMDQIFQYKINSSQLAREYCAEKNCARMQEIIFELYEERGVSV